MNVFILVVSICVSVFIVLITSEQKKNKAMLEECIKSVAEIENEQIVSVRQQETILGLAGDLEEREDAISDMATSVIKLQIEAAGKTEELEGRVNELDRIVGSLSMILTTRTNQLEMLQKNVDFDRKIQEELVRRVVRLEMNRKRGER